MYKSDEINESIDKILKQLCSEYDSKHTTRDNVVQTLLGIYPKVGWKPLRAALESRLKLGHNDQEYPYEVRRGNTGGIYHKNSPIMNRKMFLEEEMIHNERSRRENIKANRVLS